MSQLRIFCYMPSPRVYKATITARLCDVDIEIRSAPSSQLKDWLWDFDARPLTEDDTKDRANARMAHTGFNSQLYKTDSFLKAHPFGTVPAAFSSDGEIGIFESNSIMRAVARLSGVETGIYGDDPYTTSRIDSFLDASLLFARDSQIYLLAINNGGLTREIYDKAKTSFGVYMSAIDSVLDGDDTFLVNEQITLADVCFACEYAMLSREMRNEEALSGFGLKPITFEAGARFPKATNHFEKLRRHEAFSPDLRHI